MRKYIFLIISFLLINCCWVFKANSQTHTVTYDVDWITHDQNMWGPNGSPFTINMDIDLFDISYGDTTSVGSITNILGGDFGAIIDIGAWIEAAATFSMHGFTTGSIDAEFPVEIDLTFPNNYTFNPGQTVTINSDYTVQPGWDLTTHFPTAGVTQLDFFFGFGLNITATVCIWSCVTFPALSIQIPTDSINIFYLNSQTGEVAYPCWNGFFFSICHDTILPIIIYDWWNIGLTGSIDIPYIETTDWLGQDNCIYASGDDLWLTLNIDIIQFLSAIASLIPPPTGPAIQQFLGLLSGTIDLGGGFTIDYTLLSLNFGLESYMQQDFTLCPTVWTRFTMPTTVPFTVTDPDSANMQVDAGNAQVIDIETGNDLHFQYPCFGYPVWDMGIQHYLTNDFTNHTWDSMAFYFNISAFEFWINFPSFPILPDVCIPEYCINVPVPCPEKSLGTDTCWEVVCMPEICTPGVIIEQQDLTIHIGPLFSQSFPLGYIPITWYNDTWELAGWLPSQSGFYDTIMANEQIIPNPEMTLATSITTQIICFGDSTGAITATVQYGTPPYTYIWSNGDSTTTANTSNTITNVPAGTYYLTVYDSGPCYLYDTVPIANTDPQMFIELIPTQVTCVGGSDGRIIANVTGGTPPYSYQWYPIGGTTSIAQGLPADTYWVVVTDILGCDISDTTTLIELWPLPLINIKAEPDSGCQPLKVQFYETTPDSGQTYIWDFHDGVTSDEKNPLHTFYGWGDFDITCYVTSIHGCLDSLTIEDMITVFPKPNASFIPVPDDPDILEAWIYLDNTSDNTYWSYWALGDGEYSNETDPFHHYVDTGYFHVVLYVQSEHGCRDTAQRDIFVRESVTFYAPNAFTPNSNGLNETFRIEATGIDNKTFHMLIFDRWGKQVFESSDFEQGWDGKINGKPVKDSGVYSWVVTYKDIDKRHHNYRGSLLLLK